MRRMVEMPAVTSDRIVRLALSFRAAKALLSAAELGDFTARADGALDGDARGKAIGIDERGARDFFDALTALGLLARGDDGHYRNAPDADFYLDRRKPSYVGGELEHLNGYAYPHWNMLTPAFRTEKPQSGARAIDHYSPLYADPVTLERLAKGMTGGSLLAANALAAKFPRAGLSNGGRRGHGARMPARAHRPRSATHHRWRLRPAADETAL